MAGKGAATASPRAEKYRAFFQRLLDTLREVHRFTNAKKGQPQSYYNFSIGYGWRVTLAARFGAQEWVTIEVYIDSQDRGWNSRLFHALQESQDEIEQCIGEDLFWDYDPSRKSCRIVMGAWGKN